MQATGKTLLLEIVIKWVRSTKVLIQPPKWINGICAGIRLMSDAIVVAAMFHCDNGYYRVTAPLKVYHCRLTMYPYQLIWFGGPQA